MKDNSIHIMGLGWLGRALAETLLRYGANVSGSVTTTQKQQDLQFQSFSTDIFDLYKPISIQHTNNKQALATRFKNATLILNIPPGRKNVNKALFIPSMLTLIDYAMSHGLHKLVFISTTSVFGEQYGTVDNNTALQAKTESGKAHEAIEAHLARHYLSKSKILRPSGLVGPNNKDCNETGRTKASMRHPIFSLCHKTDIPNGNDPVNLIHQYDVIQAIIALVTKDIASHAFNLSAIEHPSRQAYYEWCAKELSLPIPTFLADTKKRQLGKLIDATQSFIDLGLTPKYSSPFAML
ncbi:MAG: nucleoside-diphosphate-sugar epimerase [Alphaproteobacteria bacterium]|jgi:nucleoside-diphosphate-sugar epimerase